MSILFIAGNLLYFEIEEGKNELCLCNIWKTISSTLTRPEWHRGYPVWDLFLPKGLCKNIYDTVEKSTTKIVTLTKEDRSLEYMSIVTWLKQNKANISKREAKNNWTPVRKLLLTNHIKAQVPITLFHGFPDSPKQRHIPCEEELLVDYDWRIRRIRKTILECCICNRYNTEYFKRAPANDIKYVQEWAASLLDEPRRDHLQYEEYEEYEE
jgi:hypothetical protein